MVVLLATAITCTQSINLLQRITNVVGLTESQKTEIITEIRLGPSLTAQSFQF